MKKDKKLTHKNGFALILILCIVGLLIVLLGFFVVVKENKESIISGPRPLIQATSKPITKDNSDASIEEDINSTIILEEDFSDL